MPEDDSGVGVVQGMCTEGEQARCIEGHRQKSDFGELTLLKDDIVKIVSMNFGKDQGLCLVRLEEKEGLFPISFLQPVTDKSRAEGWDGEDVSMSEKANNSTVDQSLEPTKLDTTEYISPPPSNSNTYCQLPDVCQLPTVLLEAVENPALKPVMPTKIEGEPCEGLLLAELERKINERSPNPKIKDQIAKNKVPTTCSPVLLDEAFQKKLRARKEKAENAHASNIDDIVNTRKFASNKNEENPVKFALKSITNKKFTQSGFEEGSENKVNFLAGLKKVNLENACDNDNGQVCSELLNKLSNRLSKIEPVNNSTNIEATNVKDITNDAPCPPRIPPKPKLKVIVLEQALGLELLPPPPESFVKQNVEITNLYEDLPPPPPEFFEQELELENQTVDNFFTEFPFSVNSVPAEVEVYKAPDKFVPPIPPPLPNISTQQMKQDTNDQNLDSVKVSHFPTLTSQSATTPTDSDSRSQLMEQIRVGKILKSASLRDVKFTTPKSQEGASGREKVAEPDNGDDVNSLQATLRKALASRFEKIADSDNEEDTSPYLEDDDEW